jgi:hypothetical protein
LRTRLDLRRIAEPYLDTQFRQQPLEPAGVAGGLFFEVWTIAENGLIAEPLGQCDAADEQRQLERGGEETY